MHPPLILDKHPHCKQQILALIQCHADNPIAKFWGVCNDQKWALDRCLREEKKIKIAANKEKALQSLERRTARLKNAS